MPFSVTYNGNGNTGGSAPTDSNSYNKGDTVNVQGAGTLTLTGATFAYWNTAADGSGTIYGWPAPTSFPMPAANVTLYAQWFVTTGLSNGGATAHYALSYDNSLQASGLEPTRTNTLLKASPAGPPVVENDYSWMANLFPGVNPTGPSPIPVYVTRLTGGANNTGPIRLKPNGNDPNELRSYLISEVTESFMQGQNKGWGFVSGVIDEESCGEGLSLFLTQQFELLQSIPGPYTAFTANGWLNSSLPTTNPNSTQLDPGSGPITSLTANIDNVVTTFGVADATTVLTSMRFVIQIDNEQMLVTAADTGAKTITVTRGFNGTTAAPHAAKAQISHNYEARYDYVNSTFPYPGNGPGTGCSILFIYYLYHQLQFTIGQICGAAPGYDSNGKLKATAPLQGVYQTLTGDSGDPFPLFRSLLDNAFPPDQVATIPGSLPDDPWPLALLSFWVDKSTFGKDEVNDVIKTSGGVWPQAFWIVVEGFSKNSFNALGVTIPAPTGAFANLSSQGVTISPNPNIVYENAANPTAPQRIRIPYDIKFTSLASFPASGSQTYQLDATVTVGGKALPNANASTQFELVAGADPYFTNIDPTQNNVFYLSQDLRVFTGTPAETNLPVAGGPSFSSDSTAGAYSYIQALLIFLNANYFDPNGADPFTTILPSQFGALSGDSSVTPFDNVEDTLFNNYNFAVARVRLRGTAGPSGKAAGVRVFFRLWTTQTADTDYQTASTFTSTNDASGQPIPTVGMDHHTIPFFATGDLSTQTDYAAGGPNVRDVEIPTTPPGLDSVWAYFGCFLNLYDKNNVIDGKEVQAWLNGTHHCLVAQIVFSGTPLSAGDTPESSDKLAQRNLQITRSDNPGPPATHRIPQTFDIRPSGASSGPDFPAGAVDELMIDWGDVPVGSTASIYWPAVSATEVLALASQLHIGRGLSAADAHTIQCQVTGGATYIPIPIGTGDNYAGLFTLDLPPSVTVGQEFNVVVRRIGTQQGAPPIIIHSPHLNSAPSGSSTVPTAVTPGTFTWRYVVGTFQVKIPVSTAADLLFPEENTLAIMKWRLLQMAPTNRWYPVLKRYISYLAGRVAGLGGDPGAIPPSPTGVNPKLLMVHKRIVLKIWRAGDMLTDNAHEIEWLERNGWRVVRHEKLFDDPDSGTCEILFLLERDPSVLATDDYPPPIGGGVMKPIQVTVPSPQPIIAPSKTSIILSCSMTRGRILVKQLDPPAPANDLVITAVPASRSPAVAAGVFTASICRTETNPGTCLIGVFCINDADPFSPPHSKNDPKGYPESPPAVVRVEAFFAGDGIAFTDAGPVTVVSNEPVPAGEMRVFYVQFVNKT